MYANKPIPQPFGKKRTPAPRNQPRQRGTACHPLALWLLWELLRG
ncbi:hypothetical protein [Anaerotignum lactatifermentans]|nr:hypothetical protein [Anaerotignum lactatifermentans]